MSSRSSLPGFQAPVRKWLINFGALEVEAADSEGLPSAWSLLGTSLAVLLERGQRRGDWRETSTKHAPGQQYPY